MTDFNRIKGCLRKAFMMSELRKQVLLKLRIAPNRFICTSCKVSLDRNSVQVDHISPVSKVDTGFIDWNTYLSRLFCSIDNLTTLCKPCHKLKTKEEQTLRKQNGTGMWAASAKKAQSDAHKGRYKNTIKQQKANKIRAEKTRKPVRATNVLNPTNIVEYPSIQFAARALGLQATLIVACCKSRKNRNSTGGYTFEYIKR